MAAKPKLYYNSACPVCRTGIEQQRARMDGSLPDGSDTIHVVPESRNLPVEFVETRFPVRVETLGLATDSGGAGAFRGGLGYRKEIRALHDANHRPFGGPPALLVGDPAGLLWWPEADEVAILRERPRPRVLRPAL